MKAWCHPFVLWIHSISTARLFKMWKRPFYGLWHPGLPCVYVVHRFFFTIPIYRVLLYSVIFLLPGGNVGSIVVYLWQYSADNIHKWLTPAHALHVKTQTSRIAKTLYKLSLRIWNWLGQILMFWSSANTSGNNLWVQSWSREILNLTYVPKLWLFPILLRRSR